MDLFYLWFCTKRKHINENRDSYESKSDKEKRYNSYKIGSFIGVCMIKNFNGFWTEKENGLGVQIKDHVVFPIQKTYKFLNEDGIFESLSSFYEISGVLDRILEKKANNPDNRDITILQAKKVMKSKNWWEFWK